MLKLLKNSVPVEEIEEILKNTTIFDKIEFSGIPKQTLKDKLKDLNERRVPNRTVMLHMNDSTVVDYWFRNWLHPALLNCVAPSPVSKIGCSKKVIQNDIKRDQLRFYENGQQNFDYTIEDITNYINE